MKIFISADIEGINGVSAPDDINTNGAGYETARKYMTEEANAVIEGLFSGGASDVLICDSHGDARNIILDLLDDRAALIRGGSRQDSMVHGIDESFDGLVCLGYHAKFGTMNAVLDHSYSPSRVRDIRINGKSYGELGVNALFAASYGVPLIMATGDSALAAEAKDFYAGTETVIVKYAEGRFSARCLPQAETRKRLTETAESAIRAIREKKTVDVPQDIVLEMTMQKVNYADGIMRMKDMERVDSFTVRTHPRNMRELMGTRQIMIEAAGGFSQPQF